MITKLRSYLASLFTNRKAADNSLKEMDKIFEGLKLKKKLDKPDK